MSVIQILGEIWSLPNTLLGILVGLAAGGLPRRVPGRSFLGVPSRGPLQKFVRSRRISATTFGSIVVFWRPDAIAEPGLLDHEEVHVRQYRVLGPFFLPIYLFFLPFTGFRQAHPLEAPAYRKGHAEGELDTRSQLRP